MLLKLTAENPFLGENILHCLCLQGRTYEGQENACAAFLSNHNTLKEATVEFRGAKYYLPPRSISILPDCKTVVYNTRMVGSFLVMSSKHAEKS